MRSRATLRCTLVVLVALTALVAAGVAASASSRGLSADPAPLEFGTVPVGSSKTLLLTVTNTGTQTIPAGGLEGTFRGGPDLDAWWSLYDSTCPPAPNGLAAGESCPIKVTFQPIRKGRHKSHLVLVDNRGETLSVPVSGIGA